MKTNSAREAALEALLRIEEDKAYVGPVLGSSLGRLGLSAADRGLYYNLVYGVITHRLAIDHCLGQLCKKGLKTMKPEAVNILRLGAVQLLFMDKIPAFAAVNEMVDIARKRLGKAGSGFINAVLRNIIRQGLSLFADLKSGTSREISIRTSHPLWLVEKWQAWWGHDFTKELCEANNRPGPLTVRVNTRRISREDYLKKCEELALYARASEESPLGVVFAPGTGFSALPGFQEGWFIVQGEASQLPALALNPGSGDKVLDMCSAPGGKTAQLAAASGQVVALELYPQRVVKVKENLARLGLDNVELKAGDARFSGLGESSFDDVLLDAPCSGFGVIRNKPDIKWSREEKDILELNQLQRELLAEGARVLKPGGSLVYATCTLVREENEDMAQWAMMNLPVKLTGFSLPSREAPQGMLTVYPHRDGLDGFFIAKFIKV